MENLDQDPEIKAARRRIHMWLGTLTTVAAIAAIALAFVFLSRLGFSPWETLKLGLPVFLGIAGFLLFMGWFSIFTARKARKAQGDGEGTDSE